MENNYFLEFRLPETYKKVSSLEYDRNELEKKQSSVIDELVWQGILLIKENGGFAPYAGRELVGEEKRRVTELLYELSYTNICLEKGKLNGTLPDLS